MREAGMGPESMRLPETETGKDERKEAERMACMGLARFVRLMRSPPPAASVDWAKSSP